MNLLRDFLLATIFSVTFVLTMIACLKNLAVIVAIVANIVTIGAILFFSLVVAFFMFALAYKTIELFGGV